MIMMPDLFGSPLLPSLAIADAVITPDEEAALIERIDQAGLAPFRFQQWTGKRLTRSFGWSYDFTNGAFDAVDPIPDWLLPVRAAAARFARVPETDSYRHW